MSTVTKPYPKEFRDDVVRVALNRESGRRARSDRLRFRDPLHHLYAWMKKADVETGKRPGTTSEQAAELAAAKRRIRTLEQEVEVLRKAAAYFSQAHLPGK